MEARKKLRKVTRSLMTALHDELYPEFAGRQKRLFEFDQNRQAEPNNWLREHIRNGQPFCAARFGSDELEITQQWRRAVTRRGMARLLDTLADGDPFFTYFTARHRIQKRGVTPLNAQNRERFAKMMLESMAEVDLLGSWVPGEAWFHEQMPQANFAKRKQLEPYFHSEPWTMALEGKRVLVVHPFDESIPEQYKKRSLLFGSKPILPEFTLLTHKPPRAHFGEIRNANHWFQLLGQLTQEVREQDFDVALIGAGPFGLPLATEVKKAGRQSVHLGGALQLVFGIKGKRWESYEVSRFFNDMWVRPSAEETPSRSGRRMSQSSYW